MNAKLLCLLTKENGEIYLSEGDIDENDRVLYDCETRLCGDGFFSLQDFLVFWKIKTLEKFNHLPSYQKMKEKHEVIHKTLQSFMALPYSARYETWDHVPKRILEAFLFDRQMFLTDVLVFIRDIAGERYQKIEDWLFSSRIPSILDKAQYDLVLADGEIAKIKLEFAENYRFKSAHDHLSVFTIPKEKRDIIIPQDEDSFLFAADFRQFEMRTYLNLIGETDCLQNESLYDTFGERFGLDPGIAKQQMIANLYAPEIKNSKIAELFNRESLLSRIDEGFIEFEGKTVFCGKEGHEGKIVHSINQTLSQFYMIEALDKSLSLLHDGLRSSFVFPLHDELIFSIRNDEVELIDEIKNALENDVYKIKARIGKNLKEMKELEL